MFSNLVGEERSFGILLMDSGVIVKVKNLLKLNHQLMKK